MLKDKNTPQPFSEDIGRVGVKFSMPLFVKSIYTMIDKAKVVGNISKTNKELKLLKNEAILVGANANLEYLEKLQHSIELKKKSLEETLKTIKIKVENGRLAKSSLYKIQDNINQIDITYNNIELQKQKIVFTIQKLTNIELHQSIIIQAINNNLDYSKIFPLKPLEGKIEATNLELQAQKEKLYPSIILKGNYTHSFANAYNNDESVDEGYGDIGVMINIPLGHIEQYRKIEIAKVDLLKEKNRLLITKQELESKSKMLRESLILLDNSMRLAQKSIESRKQLLDIAKVNYKSGRMTTEEYLRYEDELVDAKAKLYQAKAKKWETLMELAVIHGINIEELVK